MSVILTTDGGHPGDCPGWEYELHPDKSRVFPARTKKLLLDLLAGRIDTYTAAKDTRRFHQDLFHGLTPPSTPYFAGHYRGEPYRCLRRYQVGVGGDARVGADASTVPYHMGELANEVSAAVLALDASVDLSAAQKLYYIVVVACRAFELFLRVHPYANGNGHAGRFIVWALLGRYGHWPHKWPIDPRPGPPYTELIKQYRNGNMRPLETYILQFLTP